MNWWMVLSAGLLAGATTCAATQGGLLVGLIARQKRAAGAVVTHSFADDVAPVAGFLTGKFLSHTVLGALLGSLGSLVGFNPKVGALAQWIAGLLMITLGLGALGVAGFRDIQFTPPSAWLNIVRKNTRSQSVAAPFLLGFTVVLIPCGVTISMEVLAATSGSPLTGAAVMALFVIGTAPMFTVFGFLSQRFANRALSLAMGAVVVALGLVTVNAGLVASGSSVTAQGLFDRVSGTTAKPVQALAQTTGPQTIRITTKSDGYSPNDITASAGSDIKLVFVTKDNWSCIRATTMPTLDRSVLLPATGSTTLDVGTLDAGDYPIACSMGMYTATLHVV